MFRYILAAGACLFGGCVVDQTAEVHKYREVLDDHRPKPPPLNPGEQLTLSRAFDLANADNEQLASQGETYLQALINKNRAFSAFLPTVSFQPNFTVEQAPRGTVPPAAPGAPATSAAAVAASEGGYVQDGNVLRRFEAPVVGDLNFSFREIPQFEAAKVAVVQQRQLLLNAQETILLNVAQTYYQVVISTKQVAVLNHSLKLQSSRQIELQERQRLRLALPLEVSQAKSDESATLVQLERAENDMRNGRRTLALLIGASQVDGPLVDAILAPEPLPPISEFLKPALAERQDLVAAQEAVREARYGVKSAVAEYYPSVSLDVAGYLYREDYADASKWNGILAANLPIFTGSIRADVRDAWSRLRQAALFESYLRREIEQGVQTAYDNLITSGIVLNDLQREVQASWDAYIQAVQMEKNGLAIPLDVLTAQDTLLNSQLQFESESFTRTVLKLDLIRAAGQLDPTSPSRMQWTRPAPMAAGPAF